jgi:nucleoredoxin
MKIFLVFLNCLLIGSMDLPAQNKSAPAPANDNPLAGLNLGDTPAASSNTPPSPFVAQLKGHLLVMDHGAAKEFDVAGLNGVKYWAFYYSASWCGPCQAFTPKLVEFYRYFKKSHPNFEVILVGNDGSQVAMEAYMKADQMPWPSMKYPDLDQPAVSVKKYFGPGIPDLVLTDENGKVLSDTFKGKEYAGPSHVIDDIKKMVPRPEGT